MVHFIPSYDYDLPTNYSDQGAYHHYSSHLSQSSSPSSDGSFPENPHSSNPCSIVWVNSSSCSPDTLETAFTFHEPWAFNTTQVYPLSASTSPLEAPKDGSPCLFSYRDEGVPQTMAPYSRPDQADVQFGHPSVTQSSSDWIQGVESHGRNAPDSRVYFTPSPAAEPLPQQSETMHTTPYLTTSATSSNSSQHVNCEKTEVKRENDRNEPETNSTSDDGPADLPYSHLIAEALKTAPDRKRTLQEIYSWFEQNTSKGRDQRSKGWQNSIRHNLSMNAGFEAVKVESPNGKKAVNYWRLTDEAYRKGIQSTTRYRKQANHKRALGSDPPAPQRQRSGAKGGKATKIAAKYRGQMMLMTGGQQDAAQRERLYLQPAPFQQQQLPSQMGHYIPYLRTAPSLATVSPTRVSGPPTLTHRPSAEQYQLGVIGCTEAPCTPLFYDMAKPNEEYYCFAHESRIGVGVESNSLPNGLPTVNSWLVDRPRTLGKRVGRSQSDIETQGPVL